MIADQSLIIIIIIISNL